MKILLKIFAPVILMISLLAASDPVYVDLDGNGINDRFTDVDGDGICDISGKAYAHGFAYLDDDNDGMNDLYSDADGDGVNDLENRFRDRDGDGWNDNVVDADKNWINDITGLVYNRRSSGGDFYGFIHEESDLLTGGRRSADGSEQRGMNSGNSSMRDVFIDEDGDGVADDRGFSRHRGLMRIPGSNKP